jgi:hypothetical protein
MPLRGAMPTWALTPFAMSPSYIGLWYTFGDTQRFSSPTFGAAKIVGRQIADALSLQLQPMQVWGVLLLAVAVCLWVGIWLHRDAAHDNRGRLPTSRTLFLALALVAGGMFAAWWATVGAVQAYRNPAATPTGIGWLGLVSFSYVLAAVRVASGRLA